MQNDRWERLAPASGIVFVVLLIGGQPLIGQAQMDTSKPAATVARSLRDNAATVRIGVVVTSLAALALLWFGAALRARFARAEASGRLSSVAFGGSMIMSMFLLITGACMFAAVDLADWTKDEQAARAAIALAQAMFIGIVYGGAVLLGASALLIYRAAVLPRALGVIAGAGAIVSLVPLWPAGPLGGLLMMVWTIATSITLLRGKREAATDPV